VQPRFLIEILPREAQVEGDRAGGCGFAEGVAEDGPIPDGGVVAGLDDFAGVPRWSGWMWCNKPPPYVRLVVA